VPTPRPESHCRLLGVLAPQPKAEIAAAVKGGLLDARVDGARYLFTADVLRWVRSIRPTSEVKREQIEELRRWAKEHLTVDAVRGQPASGESCMEF
jgi:hypothetical protein